MRRSKRWVQAAVLAPLLAGGPVRAEVGGGLFLSVVFGAEGEAWRFDVGWGLEGYASIAGELEAGGYCTDRAYLSAIGPWIRLSFREFAPRLGLGAFWGKALGDRTRETSYDLIKLHTSMLGAELGVEIAFNETAEPGVVVGLLGTHNDFDAHLRGDVVLQEYSAGLGVHIGDRLGIAQGGCIAGRPCRTAEGMVALLPKVPDGSPLAMRWAAAAQGEWASVPAFLQLALDLRSLGAPVALIRRALAAAADEVRHTQACVQQARRWESPVVLPPPQALRAPLVGESGLVRLAVESWLDGCLGEGRAALEAREAARRAHDPAARRIQAMIARDEARHAELAWHVLDWALARGGRRVQGALRTMHGEAPPSVPSIEVPDSAAIFGQLSVRHIAALAHHQQAAARQRLGALLG